MPENKTGRFLLADGPKTLAEFNPKAVLRFSDRYCESCDGLIMGHYLRPNADPEIRSRYWCSKDGEMFSTGLKV